MGRTVSPARRTMARARPTPPRCHRLPRGDRGAGAVLLLAVVAVVVAALGWVGLLAGAQGARGRAQTAADLGALAGAQHRVLGGSGACEIAARTVRSNGATLTSCVPGAALDLTVGAAVRTVVGTATAEARAGPRGAPGRSVDP